MSTYISHKPRIRYDGLLQLRSLRATQILAVLVNLMSTLPRLRAAAPGWGKVVLDEIKAEAEIVHELLVAEVGAAPLTIQVPQELQDMLALLQRTDDLRRLHEVNRLLDNLISSLAQRIHSYAEDLFVSEYKTAGRRLEVLWFEQGRAFLKLEAKLQWAETHRRFVRPSAQTVDDLKLLHLHQTHAAIVAFNNWFATLLGIDPTQPIDPALLEELDQAQPVDDKPTQAEIEDRADALLTRFFNLTNTIWHSPTDTTHATLRGAALGTLLDNLQSRPRA
jgi:hypothetical protein